MPLMLPSKADFEARVTMVPESGCWLWMGAVGTHGYGVVTLGPKKTETAHRLSFMLYLGDPTGRFVCHSCDVRPCVNPAHLFLGDAKANALDCIEKGRWPRGETHHSSIHSDAVVSEIKARYASTKKPRQISRDMGLPFGFVHSVCYERTRISHAR